MFHTIKLQRIFKKGKYRRSFAEVSKWALDMSIEVKKLTGTTIGLALHCK